MKIENDCQGYWNNKSCWNSVSKRHFIAVLALLAMVLWIVSSAQAAVMPSTIRLSNHEEDVLIYGGSSDDAMAYGEGGYSSIISTGDVNGDNIDDILIGSHGADGPGETRERSGETYIYFGRPDLAGVKDTAGTHGSAPDVTIYGASAWDDLNVFCRPRIGDVNGDGINDIILGAGQAGGWAEEKFWTGEAYVIYGSSSLPSAIDLDQTQPGAHADVTIYGANYKDKITYHQGLFVADVTGDGIADILLGSRYADGPDGSRGDAGAAYVIYGSVSLPSVVHLDTSQPGAHQDVTIHGASADDQLTGGGGLKAADVNGDGIDDILLGARNADGPGEARRDSGEVYVVYGSGSLPSVIDMDTTKPGAHQDLTIYGAREWDFLPSSGCLRTGHVNDDGVMDILLGSPYADGPGGARSDAGEAYVIFGSDSIPAVIDLNLSEPGTHQDITIYGATEGDHLSIFGSMRTGDINGDGIPDIFLGAYQADGLNETREDSGEAYVIFGSKTPAAIIDLNLNQPGNHQDITIYGAKAGRWLTNWGTMQMGDVNGDGLNDIILSDSGGHEFSAYRYFLGETYIIYGRKSELFSATIDLNLNMPGAHQDVTIHGATKYDVFGSLPEKTGDVNGDGIDDIIISAGNADGPGESRYRSGEAYVIFGRGAPAPTGVPDWTMETSNTTDDLYGVWAMAGPEAFACGASGRIQHYDGAAWAAQTSNLQDRLNSIWGSGKDLVTVAGFNGAVAGFFGGIWYPQPLTTTTEYNGIWGTSKSNIFIAGNQGSILRYQESSGFSTLDSGITTNLFDIWGTSASNVFICGAGGTILHYDGNAWTPMSTNTSQDLFSVFGYPGSGVFAVGANGTILHYDGNAWTKQESGTTADLRGVWGNGTEFFAVGEKGWTLRHDGVEWSPMISGTLQDLHAVWGAATPLQVYTGVSTYNIYAVGANGTILSYSSFYAPCFIGALLK